MPILYKTVVLIKKKNNFIVTRKTVLNGIPTKNLSI